MKKTLAEALEYAKVVKAAGIMKKDDKYAAAKDWGEIEYAESCGWEYIGHPVDIENNMKEDK